MGFLSGKKALIVGLASDRSIAYGIAKAFHREGAELAFTYHNEKMKDRVIKLGSHFDASIYLPCDVADDQQIEDVFKQLHESWNELDILIHSVAFAPAEQIQGNYLENLTREGFQIAHDISSYSFAALAKAASPMLSEQAALLTLTYLGSSRVVANYNLMGVAKASLEANMRYMATSLGPRGIRVNAVNSGPIKTLAAAGISGFRKILNYNEQHAPLKRNVTQEQVGNAAAFLCSDLAAGITGEILNVDAGFHSVGVSELE